ncbi:MAG: tryptophan--tRNA ligase [Vampirovibrionales bacterium]|jgi:tryptophanyl-tRNA synthetase
MTEVVKETQTPPVVMSGMRATGRLHLGHYMGVLRNWVHLQNDYTTFFMVADWHSLTTKYEDTLRLPEYRQDIVLDWLGAGIDPTKATLYFQSAVPEIAELHLLLSMITPNKWCETDPTLKDMITSGELNYGLLGYPVLQTSDILAVGGCLVPVGKDQLAHLEISRDIARRFNHITGQHIFQEPRPLLTETPSVIGLDGRKMSKSYQNGIELAFSEDETTKAIKTAITDAKRLKKTDPGEPNDCVAVFPWYQTFTDSSTCETVASECRAGSRGCMDCKKQLAEAVNEQLRPVRERRASYAQDLAQVDALIEAGNAVARDKANATLQKVRRAFNLV